MSGAKPPPYVICYLCGRKYGTKSIAIHEPSCIKKWQAENKKLPKHLRRKMPNKPDYSLLNNGSADAVDQMNEMAYQAAQEQLIPCEFCGRTFLPERLGVHHRSCTADKPASVRPRTVTKSRTVPSESNSISASSTKLATERKTPASSSGSTTNQISRSKTKTPARKTENPDHQSSSKTNETSGSTSIGIPCGLCFQNFPASEIGAHLIRCNEEKTRHLRKTSSQDTSVSGSRRSPRPGTRTLKSRTPSNSTAPSIANDATYDLDSPDEEPETAKPRKTTKSKEKMTTPSTRAENINYNDDKDGSIDLSECSICGRRFAFDRLSKHMTVCQKTTSKTRKTFDSSKQRNEGTDNAAFVKQSSKTQSLPKEKPKSNWRQTHQDFIRSIRAAKQVTTHMANGGKASDLPPPPPSLNPDYVHCEYCDRRFNPTVAERHIPKCATTQNRPKPPKQKALDLYKPQRKTQPSKSSSRGSVRQMRAGNASHSPHSESSHSPRYNGYSSPRGSTDSNNNHRTRSTHGKPGSSRHGSSRHGGIQQADPYRAKTFSGVDYNKSPSRGYSYNAANYTGPNFFGGN